MRTSVILYYDYHYTSIPHMDWTFYFENNNNNKRVYDCGYRRLIVCAADVCIYFKLSHNVYYYYYYKRVCIRWEKTLDSEISHSLLRWSQIISRRLGVYIIRQRAESKCRQEADYGTTRDSGGVEGLTSVRACEFDDGRRKSVKGTTTTMVASPAQQPRPRPPRGSRAHASIARPPLPPSSSRNWLFPPPPPSSAQSGRKTGRGRRLRARFSRLRRYFRSAVHGDEGV